MTAEERESSKTLSTRPASRTASIRMTCAARCDRSGHRQGASRWGGMLLDRRSAARRGHAHAAEGIDQRRCRTRLDRPDDLAIKIKECARSPTGRHRST